MPELRGKETRSSALKPNLGIADADFHTARWRSQ
jgi:hypothetical protein